MKLQQSQIRTFLNISNLIEGRILEGCYRNVYLDSVRGYYTTEHQETGIDLCTLYVYNLALSNCNLSTLHSRRIALISAETSSIHSLNIGYVGSLVFIEVKIQNIEEVHLGELNEKHYIERVDANNVWDFRIGGPADVRFSKFSNVSIDLYSEGFSKAMLNFFN